MFLNDIDNQEVDIAQIGDVVLEIYGEDAEETFPADLHVIFDNGSRDVFHYEDIEKAEHIHQRIINQIRE
jgi:hypothetical protein